MKAENFFSVMQNANENQLQKIRNLFSEFVAVTNHINVLYNVNSNKNCENSESSTDLSNALCISGTENDNVLKPMVDVCIDLLSPSSSSNDNLNMLKPIVDVSGNSPRFCIGLPSPSSSSNDNLNVLESVADALGNNPGFFVGLSSDFGSDSGSYKLHESTTDLLGNSNRTENFGIFCASSADTWNNVVEDLTLITTYTMNQVMGVEIPYDYSFIESRLEPILNKKTSPTSVTNYLYYLADDNEAYGTSDYNSDSATLNVVDNAKKMKETIEQNHGSPAEANVDHTTCIFSTTDESDIIDVFELTEPIPTESSDQNVTPFKTHSVSDTSFVPHNLTSKYQPASKTENAKSRTISIKPHKGCDNSNMFVPTSEQGPNTKKLCCVYCRQRFSKLVRHLETVHKNEVEVKAFQNVPIGSKERRYIIDRIRKKGQFEWNTNSEINGGEFLVSRRPNKKFNKKADEYKTCANCFGQYTNNVLRSHWNKCTNNFMKRERVVKVLARAVEGRLHADACDELGDDIFPRMRENDCVKVIRYDWLLIVFGNDLCLNYSPHFQHDLIRRKLREGGKLLIASKSICTEITDFASLFHVKHCNTVIEAIRKVSQFDPKTKTFKSPSTASSSITLINAIAELLLVECMKAENAEIENNVMRFSTVFQKESRVKINKIVAVMKEKRLRERNENIPSTGDISRLDTYLDSERDRCFIDLTSEYSHDKWVYLAKLTMASIIVFNRRRVGEIRNMQVSDFHCRKIFVNQCNDESLLDDSLENTKRLIKSRMKIRGKLNRTVPVLLKHSFDQCLELIILHRETAGVPDSNEFLFALSSESGTIRTIDAGAAIKSFSELCGASNPTSLRGTKLRKHIASLCSTMNLNDNDVTNLANFMGHDDKIHREVYRHHPMQREVVQMTELLEAAQGKKVIATGTTDVAATKKGQKRTMSDVSGSKSTAKKRKYKQASKKSQNKKI